jgi:hypothetical protein
MYVPGVVEPRFYRLPRRRPQAAEVLGAGMTASEAQTGAVPGPESAPPGQSKLVD